MPLEFPDIDTIADYIIVSRAKRSQVTTPQLLQRLVYYVQAWALAISGRAVLKEKFEAWPIGPVNAKLHARFKGGHTEYRLLGESDLRPNFSISGIPLPLRKHIEEVLDAYSDYSLYQLNLLATTELPWVSAAKRITASKRMPEISEDAIKTFYRELWKDNSE